MHDRIKEIVNTILSNKVKYRMQTKDPETIENAIKSILSKIIYGESTFLYPPFESGIFNKKEFINITKYIEDDIDILYSVGNDVDNRLAKITSTIENIINIHLNYMTLVSELTNLVNTSNAIDNVFIFDRQNNYISWQTPANIDNSMFMLSNHINNSFKYITGESANVEFICFDNNIKPTNVYNSISSLNNSIINPYYTTFYADDINNIDSFGIEIPDIYKKSFIVGIAVKFNGFVTINEIKTKIFTNNSVSFFKLVYSNKVVNDINSLRNANIWREVENIQYNTTFHNIFNVIHTEPFTCRTMILFFTLNNPIRNKTNTVVQSEISSYDILKKTYLTAFSELSTNDLEGILNTNILNNSIVSKNIINANEYIFGIFDFAVNYNTYSISSFYLSEIYKYQQDIKYSKLSLNAHINTISSKTRKISEYLLSEPEIDTETGNYTDDEYVSSFVYGKIHYGNNIEYIIPEYNKNRKIPVFSELLVDEPSNMVELIIPFKIDIDSIDDIIYINGTRTDTLKNIFIDNIVNKSFIKTTLTSDFYTTLSNTNIILTTSNQVVLYAKPYNDISVVKYDKNINMFVKGNMVHLNEPVLYICGEDESTPEPKTIIKRFTHEQFIANDYNSFIILNDGQNPLGEFNMELPGWMAEDQPDTDYGWLFTDLHYVSYNYSNEVAYVSETFNTTADKGDTIDIVLSHPYVYMTVVVYINGTKFDDIVIYPSDVETGTTLEWSDSKLKTISFIAQTDITETDEIVVCYYPIIFAGNTLPSYNNNINQPYYQFNINITEPTSKLTISNISTAYNRIVENNIEWNLTGGKFVNRKMTDITYTPIILTLNGVDLQYLASSDDFINYTSSINPVYSVDDKTIYFNKPISGNLNAIIYQTDNNNRLELELMNLGNNIVITNTVYSYKLSTYL